MSVTEPAFQRAFLAFSYVAGRRNAELTSPLSPLCPEAKVVADRLAHPERERRAEVLARELSRVAIALDARRLR